MKKMKQAPRPGFVGIFLILCAISVMAATSVFAAGENIDITVNGHLYKLDQGGLQINPDGTVTVNMYDPDPSLGFNNSIKVTVTGAIGAEIFLKPSGASMGAAKFARIDRNGEVRFENLPAGSFELIPVLDSYTFTPTSDLRVIDGTSPVADVQFAGMPALVMPSCSISNFTLVIGASTATPVAMAVTPDKSGSGGGSASSSQLLTRTYDSGATVTVTAPASSGGNNLSGWSGCDGVSGSSCTVIMNAGKTVTAKYDPPVPYTLTVASSGVTGIAMTVSPSDNSQQAGGSTNFTRTYTSGTTVSLTAPSSVTGYIFGGWSGCTGGSGTSCTVDINGNKTVTATYNPVYTLTIGSNTNGTATTGVAMTVSPADNSQQGNGNTSFIRTYPGGTTVTITAPASSGGVAFNNWSGCTSSSGTTCTATLNTSQTVTAYYGTPPPVTYTLTVTSSGASGVAMTVVPADNSQQAGGNSNFTRTYNSGTSITVTAPATSGSLNFSGWSGCTSTSGTSCTVALSSSRTVTASYSSSPGGGSGNTASDPKVITLSGVMGEKLLAGQSKYYKFTIDTTKDLSVYMASVDQDSDANCNMLLMEGSNSTIDAKYASTLIFYTTQRWWGSLYGEDGPPRFWSAFSGMTSGESLQGLKAPFNSTAMYVVIKNEGIKEAKYNFGYSQ